MKRLHLTVPHELSQEEAKTRLTLLADYYVRRHGAKVSWQDCSADVRARYLLLKIEGRVVIDETTVRLEGPDPGRLLRKKALAYVKRRVQFFLDPTVPVDALPASG